MSAGFVSVCSCVFSITLVVRSRCVTWPVWPVRTRAITGQHRSTAQTGQHGPGRVRHTAPAQCHTHYTHPLLTHSHTPPLQAYQLCYTVCSSFGRVAVFYSKNRYDETTAFVIDPCHACAFREVGLRFKKKLASTHTDQNSN